jgi:hypothetical protein
MMMITSTRPKRFLGRTALASTMALGGLTGFGRAAAGADTATAAATNPGCTVVAHVDSPLHVVTYWATASSCVTGLWKQVCVRLSDQTSGGFVTPYTCGFAFTGPAGDTSNDGGTQGGAFFCEPGHQYRAQAVVMADGLSWNVDLSPTIACSEPK